MRIKSLCVSVCVCVCVCVTCHVAVDQLRFDWSTAVHVDIKMSRRVAVVFVRLAGLLVHSWEENNEISCSVNHININTSAGRRTQEQPGDEDHTLWRILGAASYACITTESLSHNQSEKKFYFCSSVP